MAKTTNITPDIIAIAAALPMFSEETAMLFDKVIPYTFRTGGEGGLNPVGSSIEATMIFGDAIHNVILEDWSTEYAINWIDEQIQALLLEDAS